MDHQNFIALEDIRIAKPCRADWDAMTGSDRARFCGSCHKNVYDISRMTREGAEALIREREGNVCLRLHRRADGTVITSDCPVGLTVARRPFFGLMAGVAALLASGVAVANGTQAPEAPDGQGSAITQRWSQRLLAVPFISFIADKIAPVPPPVMMGDVAIMGRPGPVVPAPTPTTAPATPANGHTIVMGSPPPIMGKIAAPTPAPSPKPGPTPALSRHAMITMGEPTMKLPSPSPGTALHPGNPKAAAAQSHGTNAGAMQNPGGKDAAKRNPNKVP